MFLFYISLPQSVFYCVYTYYIVCYSFMYHLYLYHCFHLCFITFIIVTLIILAKVLYLAFNVMQSCSTSLYQIRNIVMLGIKVEYWSEWEQRKYRKSSQITSPSQTLKSHCDIPGWYWEPFDNRKAKSSVYKQYSPHSVATHFKTALSHLVCLMLLVYKPPPFLVCPRCL